MALNGILDKKLSGRLETHPLLYVGAFGVVALPVAFLGVIGLVPRPALSDLMLALVGGTCFALAVALYYRAVALDEISRLVPLFRLSSLMVLLFSALLFGERLRQTEYMAFAVMLAGSILLALKLDQGRPSLSRGAGLMAIVATLLAINSTLIAQLYYRYPLRVAFVAEQAGVAVGAVILLVLTPGKRVLWQRVRSMRHSMQAVLVGQQTVRLGTSYLSAYVLTQVGSAALVSVMSGLRPFFVLILASWLLDEPVDRRSLAPKLAGLGCMSVGMVLLAA
jgi:transporter family protein